MFSSINISIYILASFLFRLFTISFYIIRRRIFYRGIKVNNIPIIFSFIGTCTVAGLVRYHPANQQHQHRRFTILLFHSFIVRIAPLLDIVSHRLYHDDAKKRNGKWKAEEQQYKYIIRQRQTRMSLQVVALLLIHCC